MRLYEILEAIDIEKQNFIYNLANSLLNKANIIEKTIESIEQRILADTYIKACLRTLTLEGILNNIEFVIKKENNEKITEALQSSILKIKSLIKRNNLLILTYSK